MRRCLAVLWWSCGGAAGSLTLWISGRGKISLHTWGLIPEKRPCRRTAARKTNNCWHPNQKNKQNRNVLELKLSGREHEKKQKTMHSGKTFLPSVLRRLHPCQVQMMKMFSWLSDSLSSGFSSHRTEKSDSLKAKTDRKYAGQTNTDVTLSGGAGGRVS